MEKLRKYAELAVRTGVNLQKDGILVVNSPVECYDFTRLVVAEGYKAGAKEVVVHWNDEVTTQQRYLFAADELFDTMPSWQVDSILSYSEQGACFLTVYAADPNLLKNVDVKRISRNMLARKKALKPHRDRIDLGKNRWSIVSIPTAAWACEVFKGVTKEEAMSKLWDAIFASTRINEADPVKAWEEHNNNLKFRMNFLNEKKFRKLHYKNALGTDLVVELPLGHIWVGGAGKDENGIEFIANMPTEEVFTMPVKTGVNGKLVSTKPLEYNGSLITNFTMEFKDGKVVNYSAETAEESLKSLIDTDEGSAYLGEVALVPFKSPISDLGIVFFNTLYDENASCHFALGSAYLDCIENGTKLSAEEKAEKGVNTSLAHTDFMVGSEDLLIMGITEDGEEVKVFQNGNWAF